MVSEERIICHSYGRTFVYGRGEGTLLYIMQDTGIFHDCEIIVYIYQSNGMSVHVKK